MNAGSLFSELKRRRVWRVAGGYILVVWMAVEIVVETFPLLGAPDWVPRVVVILAFVGFPITVLLAWLFDITPDGVVRTRARDEVEAGADTDPSRVVVQAGPARLAGVFGAGMLVALVGFGAYSMVNPRRLVRPESIQSIAVLPFSDLSPAGDQAYFADGVTEELINRLARLEEIRVAGRTSSFAFRGRDAGLEEIAGRLGVEAVVEGSLRRDGDQLRVSVELVDVATGFQIWSESYDRTVDDIFAIQDDIATAIVDALRVQLVPGTSRLRAGTSSVRAHDAYLLGLARWHTRTETDLLRALEYFQQAVEEDQSYAPAHAGLALTYAVLPTYTGYPVAEAADRGSQEAARALALNAQLAEGHAAIGQIAQALEWNLDAAEMAYERAVEFQPNYATAHQWYAEALIMMGRLTEAQVELDRAGSLDPLAVAIRHTRAYLHVARRELDAARRAYERLLADNPGYALGHTGLVLLCLVEDCHDEARIAARAAFPPDVARVVTQVIDADADPSLRVPALRALDALDDGLTTAHRALYHAALGDGAGALDRLEQAYQEGADPNFLFYLVHPLFDGIRRDARFEAIAGGLGVEAPFAGLPPR
ncbi:MAG: tetratricopeptide repeat protein [Candidatus Longimicrobiales bacterium M2_2A_002]